MQLDSGALARAHTVRIGYSVAGYKNILPTGMVTRIFIIITDILCGFYSYKHFYRLLEYIGHKNGPLRAKYSRYRL